MNTYEGEKNYIFVSYSHKDRKKVMPMIERLQKDGYRLWYDEEIEAGTEWPETVAEHLGGCALFLAVISGEYLESFNCRREIDYAVSKRKAFIAVMLEDVTMTPGMEMQLSSVQFLNRHQMKEEAFFEKLYQSELVKPCLADKDEEPETVKSGTEKSGRKLSVKRIAAITAGVILAGGIIFFAGWNLTHITIAGQRYLFNEQHLTIENATLTPADTGKLRRFTNLALISFENCDFAEDSENNLAEIKGSVNSFHVTDCTGIENYNWLGSIRGTKWLEIRNSGFDDEAVSELWFMGMNDLVGLDLSDNKDFSNLGGFLQNVNPGLQQLKVAGTGVFNLAPLKDFESLYLIDIGGCEVETLEPLNKLKNVTFIDADDNKLKSLEGLEDMYELDTLSAAGNALESIDAIKDNTMLKRVDFSDNRISDVSPLEKSRITLEKVFLDNNGIADMSPLAGMRSLSMISVDGNALTDLDFLEGADGLEVLSARNNGIKDIGMITGLRGIRELYLSGNQIEGDLVFSEDFGSWNNNLDDSVGARYIQLQHNKIRSLEFQGKNPWSLAVYDNPLKKLTGSEEPVEAEMLKGSATFVTGDGHTLVVDDYEEETERKGSMSGTAYAYISWDAGGNDMLGIISSFDRYTDVYLSGCPLDYQSQLEELITGVRHTTNDSMDDMMEQERTKNMDIIM